MEMNVIDWAREIRETPIAFDKMFGRPKCKPWDLAKGKRFECCHYLKEQGHSWWCLNGLRGKVLRIPPFKAIKSEEI